MAENAGVCIYIASLNAVGSSPSDRYVGLRSPRDIHSLKAAFFGP